MDILALLQCLLPLLTPTTLHRLAHIVLALLSATGRITMSGIARWGDDGTSYRTVQRFFATLLPWPQLFWLLFSHHHFQPDDVYILAGDEVVVSKAGKKTYGLDRFFSGIVQRPIPSVAFFSLALVSTKTRRAFPLRLEQIVRSEAEKAAAKTKASTKKTTQTSPKRSRGRPKGSTTKTKMQHILSPELQRIQRLLQEQLALCAGTLPLIYLALDGHFGTAPAIQMVQGCGLQIISKLRSNAALYLAYEGPYQGRGPRRKYGEKLDIKALPTRFLRQRQVEDGIETCIYQLEALQKEVAGALNVVVMVKTNLRTQKRAHVVLFSSDVTLALEQVIEYYSLRFQIEFTFRDAKQYWGLEDFMNVTARGVENAANLALFMVSVSAVLLREERVRDAACSVLDLKARYRGTKYVEETLKLLPEKLEEDLMMRIVRQVTRLGRIHPAKVVPKAA